MRQPIQQFVQTQLGPSDMIGLMYPLESVFNVRMTRNHNAVVSGVEPLLRKAAAVDRMVASARRHPVVTVLGAAAVALLASRKVFDLATRVLTIYALFKR